MYYVVRQIETGEFVDVALHNDLQQALAIAELLNAEWPGEYFVKDAEGDDVIVNRIE